MRMAMENGRQHTSLALEEKPKLTVVCAISVPANIFILAIKYGIDPRIVYRLTAPLG
jgi:hypothetical protein